MKNQNTKANQTSMPSIEGSRQSEKRSNFHETFKIRSSKGPNSIRIPIASEDQSYVSLNATVQRKVNVLKVKTQGKHK